MPRVPQGQAVEAGAGPERRRPAGPQGEQRRRASLEHGGAQRAAAGFAERDGDHPDHQRRPAVRVPRRGGASRQGRAVPAGGG